MAALALATLATLPDTVAKPAYAPEAVAVGILHLGLGAFHRAHQAVYTDTVLAREPRWGICGVSLKTPHATVGLAAQDGLYTVLVKGAEGTTARVIGALRETRFAGADRAGLIARFADPRVTVITLTVTEKGYCHDPATGALDETHPDVVHDLAHPQAPVSAVGMLVAGLAARRGGSGSRLSVVCCDNLPHNGPTVEGIVRRFAALRDPVLAEWIAEHVAFPGTMVDRIVPATTDADLAEAARMLGVTDAAPVVSEPYTQWVIEDRFAAARPAWEDAGAQLVADVAPFETMKLRLLNGSHSTLAYLGFLMGHATIAQASADPLLATLIERLMAEEVAPTLATPPGTDLAVYRAKLIARFRNPTLPHRTQQIAMDGSQKLPQRLLGTVRDRIAGGSAYPHLALAIAGWIRYASGVDEHGQAIEVSDPLAGTFAAIAQRTGREPRALADAFIDLQQVFGRDLPRDIAFRSAVKEKVVALFENGARATVAAHLGLAPLPRS